MRTKSFHESTDCIIVISAQIVHIPRIFIWEGTWKERWYRSEFWYVIWCVIGSSDQVITIKNFENIVKGMCWEKSNIAINSYLKIKGTYVWLYHFCMNLSFNFKIYFYYEQILNIDDDSLNGWNIYISNFWNIKNIFILFVYGLSS